MTPEEKALALMKGCETEIDVIEDSEGEGQVIICGEYCIRKKTGERVLRLCQSCQRVKDQMLSDFEDEKKFLEKTEIKHWGDGEITKLNVFDVINNRIKELDSAISILKGAGEK